MTSYTNVTARQYLDKYIELVREKPEWVQQIASLCKLSSYFVAGSMSNACLYYELIQSSSNLVSLLNHTLVRPSLHHPPRDERLRLVLSVCEYVEVLGEMFLRKRFGDRAKWRCVWLLQGLKAVVRLVLLLHYRSGVLPLPPCGSHTTEQQQQQQHNNCVAEKTTVTVRLERSGRVMRKLTSSLPPIEGRAVRDVRASDEESRKTMSELLHILKPLLHLICLSTTKPTSWMPWLAAAATDATSLYLVKDISTLSTPEKHEIDRRYQMLMCYLLRSPCYDVWTRQKIINSLRFVSKIIPGGGNMLGPLVEYLDEWQESYFFLWSN